MKKSPEAPSWLEQAYPQMHFLLLALDGDEAAPRWLAHNSPGMALFARALAGEQPALAGLQNGHAEDLDDLFEVIDNDDLGDWLEERRPELHLLFEAIKGDGIAAARLKKHKSAHARLLPKFREVHDRFLQRTRDVRAALEGHAAEVGCLVGEMHLRQGEYEKAIEAFSRALDTHPAPDLYLGRAKAYRGLAERDESAAVLLRQSQA
jgi:tetratricopeptide (TPR) repeat protein